VLSLIAVPVALICRASHQKGSAVYADHIRGGKSLPFPLLFLHNALPFPLLFGYIHRPQGKYRYRRRRDRDRYQHGGWRLFLCPEDSI
jgi:hypothetical protein